MQGDITRYSPSGAYRPIMLLYVLGALVGACFFAGLYTLLMDVIPYILASICLLCGFGFMLGLMSASVITQGHCRNRPLGLGLGLLVGFVGLAASHVLTYLNTLHHASLESGASMGQLVAQVGLETWVRARMETGWQVSQQHSSQLDDFKGFWVLLFWLVEACLIMGVPFKMAGDEVDTPYCESCEDWTQSQSSRLHGVSRGDVQPLLDRGDLSGLIAMEGRSGPPGVSIQLERRYCAQCMRTAYLNVQEIHVQLKGGKEQERKVELLKNALLTQRLSDQYAERFFPPGQDVVPATAV